MYLWLYDENELYLNFVCNLSIWWTIFWYCFWFGCQVSENDHFWIFEQYRKAYKWSVSALVGYYAGEGFCTRRAAWLGTQTNFSWTSASTLDGEVSFEVLMKIFKQVFVCMCFEICIIIRIYHANMYNFSGHIFLWYQSLQVWFIKLYKIEIYHPWWLTLLFIQIVRQLLEEMKKSLVSSCSGYFLFYSFKMILFDPWYHYVQSVKYVCEKLALWAKVWMLDDASSWQVACAITSWPWNGGDYVLIIKFHNTVNMLNQG